MKSKGIMTALAVAVAMVSIVAVLQTGGGVDEVDATTTDDIQAAFQNGGSYTLTSDIEINGGTVSKDLVLNLNGNTITTTGMITVNAHLTIMDGAGSEGSIVSTTENINLINVSSSGSLTIDSGIIALNSGTSKMHTIVAYGNVDINGGTLERLNVTEPSGGTYVIRQYDGVTHVDDAIINTNDSGIAVRSESNSDPKCYLNGVQITAGEYGIGLFGIGSMSDNDSVTLTIDDTVVNADVALGTNASSGQYAGFTITINGGTFTGTHGMYLPGYGVYNVNGGTFIGSVSGIQIAAGILNIREGAVVQTTGVNDGTYNSLVSSTGSGPGDIKGAIVIGKASSGYVGDVEINILGGTISAPEGGDAIVACDNATGEEELLQYTSEVKATGGEINGNVTFTTATDTNHNNPDKKAPNKVSFNLGGANVNGSIVKDETFQGDVGISSGSVSGDVEGEVTTPAASGTVYYADTGASYSYYGSFKLPMTHSQGQDGYTFLGFSLSSNATVADYALGDTVTVSGNVTVYEVWESDTPLPPIWDDDDEYIPPIVPVQPEDSGNDDTVTIVACAAAAVVAALLAVFLIIDRRQ